MKRLMMNVFRSLLPLAASALLVAAAPSTQQYYAAALNITRVLPEPSYVTATVVAEGHGIGVSIAPEHPDDPTARFRAGTGLPERATWSETYDHLKNTVVVDTGDGRERPARNTLLVPTWNGADDWLRYGLNGPSTAAQPADEGSLPAHVKMIATVTAMAPSAYRVTDGGAAECPSGTGGHRLHLDALFDTTRHPLTDVIVDDRSQRFCMLKFTIDPQHIHGGTGTVELDFADVDGFWLETRAHIEVLARVLGIGVARANANVFFHVTAAR